MPIAPRFVSSRFLLCVYIICPLLCYTLNLDPLYSSLRITYNEQRSLGPQLLSFQYQNCFRAFSLLYLGMMSKVSFIHEAALQKYSETLPPDERFRFIATTINDVLLDVQHLEKYQAMFSKTRQISRRIEPVIKFLQRYAIAVDVFVQFDPQPSALAWGCLRFLIEASNLDILRKHKECVNDS